ncbi:hypothetical protein EJ06DRAFT_529525 [Trichodelitschia bisporula]|uniref:Uncharacterized protein n=1 Tax=Trichodelitschia bisporula TaxID=703511 RepID=A0A6G1I077_9PEZI|nr:hypothetical protein EJ06DRAFT_529525 [Trichodelitschia bisporula]
MAVELTIQFFSALVVLFLFAHWGRVKRTTCLGNDGMTSMLLFGTGNTNKKWKQWSPGDRHGVLRFNASGMLAWHWWNLEWKRSHHGDAEADSGDLWFVELDGRVAPPETRYKLEPPS